MPLSPAAQHIVDAAATHFPNSMSGTPLVELRRILEQSAVPPTTPIFESRGALVPTSFGDVPVRIYRPSPEQGLPVVQWMHSGGFTMGGLDQNEEYLRKLSIAANVVIVSVDYRLAPENPYPAALDDCREVWCWIKARPAELGETIGARMAIAGESAGGTIVFVLSQQLRDMGLPMPDAQVSFYGTAEMRISNPEHSTSMLTPADCEWFWDLYVGSDVKRSSPYLNPGSARDLSGLPPALVATAEIDPTRDATEEYAHRMMRAGTRVEIERYEGMMHGFGTLTAALEPARQLFERTVDFLQSSLHPAGSGSDGPIRGSNDVRS
ncbi:alpha/beta hydrolase [Rhodococcus globerulus]|uniref:alpha/beta hydrolase n=1 Tax=Rhodococcus globerulus TaxID=33008 RepID=UPI001F448541|nr:alpha/beta hydrolase [Rhodococcus globerulus]MCE4267503.1 alpha/beta hydrolase [Rhodococcus globerulus]